MQCARRQHQQPSLKVSNSLSYEYQRSGISSGTLSTSRRPEPIHTIPYRHIQPLWLSGLYTLVNGVPIFGVPRSILDRVIVERTNLLGLGVCGTGVVSDFHDINALVTYFAIRATSMILSNKKMVSQIRPT